MPDDLVVESYAGKKLQGADFSGKKMWHADFKSASLVNANFKGTDLRYANFTSANCTGADFTGAILYRANMTDCILERSIFKPKELFGVTLTIRCETFAGMEVDETWLKAWLFMPALMKMPPPRINEKPWLDRLILFLGPETFRKYKQIFNRRII